MSASSLSDLLTRQLPPGVAARAQALLGLQRALDHALPAPLAGHVRVRTFEAGLLSLACASGAVASRLRRETGDLIAALGRRGVTVARVQITVDPELLARYVPAPEKNGLPATALDGLAQLNATIEAGPLKDALARLLRHHAGR